MARSALRSRLAEGWMRFHCGAPLTEDPKAAAFALITDLASSPALTAFNMGDAKYPDRSTTLVVQLPALEGGPQVELTGPGIKTEMTLSLAGLPDGFWAQVRPTTNNSSSASTSSSSPATA
uniref:Phosphonate C-P lyase system protein PhnH n=1 Tax=Phenylobacterium glaciei TaxID=2803784 RepID=A0A974P6I5_9CAUL|nr:phosphonate C-P lyase system protein PhnH [Phenylobacterium glaciei]